MKINKSRIIIIFIALTIAGICLVVFGQRAADSAVRTVLPLVGAAILTSGLTYFLIKLG
jgi:hypothetical protein